MHYWPILSWLTLQNIQGVGIAFGPDVTRRWCTLNGVAGIIRSHEVRQGESYINYSPKNRADCWTDGYAVEHDGLCTTVSSLVHRLSLIINVLHKVFSAPNYVDQAGNKGAFVSDHVFSSRFLTRADIYYCIDTYRLSRDTAIHAVRRKASSRCETYGVRVWWFTEPVILSSFWAVAVHIGPGLVSTGCSHFYDIYTSDRSRPARYRVSDLSPTSYAQ